MYQYHLTSFVLQTNKNTASCLILLSTEASNVVVVVAPICYGLDCRPEEFFYTCCLRSCWLAHKHLLHETNLMSDGCKIGFGEEMVQGASLTCVSSSGMSSSDTLSADQAMKISVAACAISSGIWLSRSNSHLPPKAGGKLTLELRCFEDSCYGEEIVSNQGQFH